MENKEVSEATRKNMSAGSDHFIFILGSTPWVGT